MKTTNNSITFTPGKFYRTRDGRRCEVIKSDFKGDQPIVGVVPGSEYDMIRFFNVDGSYSLEGLEDNLDLIAEWKDAPEVDWSKMPDGTVAAFKRDSDSELWYASTQYPTAGTHGFHGGGTWFMLYPQHVPKWSGDWRDSLVTRKGPQP